MTALYLVGLFLALSLTGCSGDTLPAKPTAGRPPLVADIPGADETVRGEDDPPIVTLELGSTLAERRLTRSEPLPGNIIVPSTNLNAVPVTAALQAVLAGTDISVSWDAKTWDNRLVTVTNLSGPLPKVVEKVCSSARVFCAHRQGLLELRDKESFIIELPSMPGQTKGTAANSMADAISDLAGEKVRVDQQGGNLIYTTDVEGQEMVHEYLDQLRNGRPLVVMQLHIWEVTLNKENAEGINWSSFSLPEMGGHWENLVLDGSTAFTSVASPGVSLGATLAGKVKASAVLKFLSTQGSVQNISSPQLTFISGSQAEFRVGGKQHYISQVGELVSSSVSGSSSSSGSIGNNTVSTDTVDTGLTVNVEGAYEGGVVTANLDISIQSLVKMESISTGNTEIQLPVTTDRKVSTLIRVRPGDNLVLAGMVSSKDSNTKEGIPLPFGLRAPTYGSDEIENSEVVVLVKPSVVLFSDKKRTIEEKREEMNKTTVKPLPDAVIIDKDGAKRINVPSGAAPRPSNINSSVELPTNEDPSGKLVDQQMMQTGFGQAYNEMLVGGERGL